MRKYGRWIATLFVMAMLLGGCANSGNVKSQAELEGQESNITQNKDTQNSISKDNDKEKDIDTNKDKNIDKETEDINKNKDTDKETDTSKDSKNNISKKNDNSGTDISEKNDNSENLPESENLEESKSMPVLNADTVVYAREEMVTTSSVNIRKAPSVDSEVYQTIPRKTELIRTANDGTWSAIEIEGVEYYVASEYLKLKSEMTENGHLVVIDAGHQGKGNSEQEPIGPGASETKAKVSSGTSGCVSGLNEYELTLMVSLKLQAELEARGYEVMMVRTSHDVNISNSERAAVANNAGADAFIRIHANGSDDSGENGILTICPTSANPYMGSLYSQCRSLSEYVLDGAVNATGANKKYIWETDSMSGINWCTVPVTIVEMGFMTNPTEDQNMANDNYQQQLAVGIADGLDAYFGN
ncbi:MAG: N-acetylmuramoyl-L-alanine amidase [Lachnospiraceae bacterium]